MTQQEMQKEIESLKDWKRSLESSNSIPLSVDQAFRDRFAGSFTALALSTKGADTEDVSINEAGVATKIVLDDPDGFLEVTINNVIYYLPYYT